jgi:hypothetical protein
MKCCYHGCRINSAYYGPSKYTSKYRLGLRIVPRYQYRCRFGEVNEKFGKACGVVVFLRLLCLNFWGYFGRFESASLQRPCYVSSLSECVLKAKLELGSMKSLTAAKCWVIEVQAWTVCGWQKLSSHILASSKRLCKRSLPSFSHGQMYGSIDRMVADCSTGSVVQRFRSRSVGRKSTRFVPIYC